MLIRSGFKRVQWKHSLFLTNNNKNQKYGTKSNSSSEIKKKIETRLKLKMFIKIAGVAQTHKNPVMKEWEERDALIETRKPQTPKTPKPQNSFMIIRILIL